MRVARAVVGFAVAELRGAERQRLAEQVVADQLERGQTHFQVEHFQCWRVLVVAGADPGQFAFKVHIQFEVGAEQCRVLQHQPPGVTKGGTGERGVTDHAIGRHVHAPAQLQAQVTAQLQGIGANLQFLGAGDTGVGAVQVSRSNAAASQ